jgi:HPt (histidine-containing phosphotransfer) domain-containing protein
MTSEAKSLVLDWDEAMNQVGGDTEFLGEVLQDLLDEANTAEQDIAAGIEKSDFETIMKAAHRIKGSATYLGCEALRNSAFNIQQQGHEGISLDADKKAALLAQVRTEFESFLSALENLKTEIAIWREKKN